MFTQKRTKASVLSAKKQQEPWMYYDHSCGKSQLGHGRGGVEDSDSEK